MQRRAEESRSRLLVEELERLSADQHLGWTLTADFKEMAAIKSPTELFQLQGKIMRRNFDAMVAATSKGTEAGMKLANDAFAPITARVNLTVEKLSKAA